MTPAKQAMPRGLKDVLLAPKISLICLFGAVCLLLVLGTFLNATRHTAGILQPVVAQPVYTAAWPDAYTTLSQFISIATFPSYYGAHVQGQMPGQALHISSSSTALL